MLLCKEKKKLHLSLWRIMYTLSYSERLPIEFLCTNGVSPSFFGSLPTKILIKSNQTFQIIERIYTAPYLLFIIIIIIINFTKENLRSKIYKTAFSFSVIYPVTICAHMKSHLYDTVHLAIPSPAFSATTDYT